MHLAILLLSTLIVTINAQYELITWTVTFYTPKPEVEDCFLASELPNAVTLQIINNITTPGCFTFDSVFNGTLRESLLECRNSNNTNTCPALLQDASLPNAYDPAANYSHVTFRHGRTFDYTTWVQNTSEITFTVFEDNECGGESQPEYVWSGCDEPQTDCTELPYSVGSFRISGFEDMSVERCLAGAESGVSSGGIRLAGSGLAAILVALLFGFGLVF